MNAPIILAEAPAEFSRFGVSHGLALLLFAGAAVALVARGRRVRVAPTEIARPRAPRFALVILLFQLPLQIYSMLPGQWDLAQSLPFQLCDLAWIAAVIALWTGSRHASSWLYYWGLTLTAQALLTPVLQYDFPHLQYIMFWGSHTLVVLAAIYLTWGLGFRPGWDSYASTVAVTLGWMALMLGFNALAGTNYVYVSESLPGTAIEALGPWPWYVLNEILIAAVIWAAITWPWTRSRPA